MLKHVLDYFPIQMQCSEAVASFFGAHEDQPLRALGACSIHSSYLSGLEFGAKIGAGLKLFELLGDTTIQMIIAQATHSTSSVNTSSAASEAIRTANSYIYDRLAQVLGLPESVHFGNAMLADPSRLNRKPLRTITGQLIGAGVVCLGYTTLYSLVARCLEITKSSQYIDYKTKLHAVARQWKLGQPRYSTVAATGREHCKTYRVRVTLKNQTFSDGFGDSIKEAEKRAAESYLEKYLSTLQDNHSSYNQENSSAKPHKHYDRIVFDQDRLTHLESLANKLTVPLENVELLDEALTHRSYTYEHLQCGDNALLSHLGAIFQRYTCAYILVEHLFCKRQHFIAACQPHQILGQLLSGEVTARGFDQLELDNLLLRGKGQKILNTTIKAEAFQACIATLVLSKPKHERPIDIFPEALVHWITRMIESMIERPMVAIDSKSRHQDYFQVLKLEHKYTVQAVGAAHQQAFTAIMIVTDPESGSIFHLKGQSAETKRKSEQNAADLMVKFLWLINTSACWPQTLTESNLSMTFARLIIKRGLTLASSSEFNPRAYRRLNILSASAFTEGDVSQVALWAEAITSWLERGESYFNCGLVKNYIAALRPTPKVLGEQFSAALRVISNFVNNLSSDVHDVSVRTSPEFELLLRVAELMRLISRDTVLHDLRQVFEDFVFLQRGRTLRITVELNDVSDLTVYCREGAALSLLDIAARLFEKHGCSYFSISAHSKSRRVKISFTPRTPAPLGIIITELQTGLLWEFLRAELAIVEVSCNESVLTIAMLPTSNDGSFLGDTLRALREECRLVSLSEAIVIAKLLHDLKNELIAFDLVTTTLPTDRVAKHKALLDAAIYLDNAVANLRSLESLQGALLVPECQTVSPREILKSYVATRIGNLPSYVRIDMPRNMSDVVLFLPLEYLRSLLDNLLRNSVEAMPDGGEIGLDWALDVGKNEFEIQFWDTGPGFSTNDVEAIVSGRGLPTNKRNGSGLGLITVHRMIQQLGGSFVLGAHSRGGAMWRVRIPIDSEIELEPNE